MSHAHNFTTVVGTQVVCTQCGHATVTGPASPVAPNLHSCPAPGASPSVLLETLLRGIVEGTTKFSTQSPQEGKVSVKVQKAVVSSATTPQKSVLENFAGWRKFDGPPSVMISINVKTMKESALRLKKLLQDHGVSAWVCTEDLAGGEDFRTGIAKAVRGCKVFLPLINDEWAESGECKIEYSMGLRLNLTSHERGITEKPQDREPLLMPIAFPNLNWDAHDHVFMLSCNTNFIVHDAHNLTEGNPGTFNQILYAIAATGLIDINKIQKVEAPKEAEGRPRSAASVSVPKAQHKQMSLGKEYLGTTEMISTRFRVWGSESLHDVVFDPATGKVTGTWQTATLRKEGGNGEKTLPRSHPHYSWLTETTPIVGGDFTGTFDPKTRKALLVLVFKEKHALLNCDDKFCDLELKPDGSLVGTYTVGAAGAGRSGELSMNLIL